MAVPLPPLHLSSTDQLASSADGVFSSPFDASGMSVSYGPPPWVWLLAAGVVALALWRRKG